MKKNITPIILIVLFSILLWGSVSLSGDYYTTITSPIVFKNLPQGYTVGKSSVNQVTLSVKGQGWELAKLTLGRTLDYDISVQQKEGKHTLITRNSLEQNPWAATGVQLVEITPDKIDVNVEKLVYKKVKVVPDVHLDFKPGYGLVSEIYLTPDSIIIDGAESIVKKIDSVRTEYRNLTDLEHIFSASVNLEPVDGIDFETDHCFVKFDVQKIVDKTFDAMEVETRGVPRSRELLLFPNKIQVVVRGGINILGKLTSKDIKTYVDFSTALKDQPGSIQPVIEVPKYTTVIDVKPSSLEYIIKQY